MTEKVLVVVIIFACLICLFSICMMTFDFIINLKKEKEEKVLTKEKMVKKIEETPLETVTVAEGVSFQNTKQETFREKYEKLDREHKNYCDEIEQRALNVENAKKRESVYHLVFKVKSYRLVKIVIKRGVIECQFFFSNLEFKNYTKDNKVKYKTSSTTIKVLTRGDCDAVIDTIGIVEKSIAQEVEYKKQLKSKKRKALTKA